MIVNHLHLDEYDNAFRRVPHPRDTSLIDPFSMLVTLHPDANVPSRTRCGYLVGELRRYAGTREDVAAFYTGVTLEGDWPRRLSVDVLFIDFFEDGRLARFHWQAAGPFEADILKGLHGHYSLWGTPRDLDGSEGKFYFVYVVDYGDDLFEGEPVC